MAHKRWVFTDNGKVVQAEETPPPVAIDVKPLEAELVFELDPEYPTGTKRKWRLVEVSEGRLPVLGNIYLEKAYRRIRSKAALPVEVRISIKVRYAQVEPGL